MERKVDNASLFKSVCDNAFDFLDRSISELETQPKYSIIDFWTSIELFFKARLLAEHWSLVFETISSADTEALRTGGFRSSKFEETLSRLKSITGLRINDDAERTFANLRSRRNQAVHFFHADYIENPSDELKGRIVAEQCRGWFYLHRILVGEWKNLFVDYQTKVDEAHGNLAKRHGYLHAKFDSIKDGIQKGQESGVEFQNCPACDFRASRRTLRRDPIWKESCLVCDLETHCILAECPKCSSQVQPEFGWAKCDNCGTEVLGSDLAEKYNPIIFDKDGIADGVRANCTECDTEESVDELDKTSGDYGCVACASIFSVGDLTDCTRCGAVYAGGDAEMLAGGCRACTWN